MNKDSKLYKNRHKKGQFFTDPILIKNIIKQFDLNFSNKTVIEPSCGDGSFIKTILEFSEDVKIIGVDNDKKPLQDLRSHLQENKIDNVELVNKDYMKYIGPNNIDVIIGNPPFNVKIKGYADSIEAFISKSIDMIKPGGEIIFVVPMTLFRNKKYESIRKKIIYTTQIVGIMNSSAYDFEGADIETAIIYLIKKEVTKQSYYYINNQSIKQIDLHVNDRFNILLDNIDSYRELIDLLDDGFLSDKFYIYRGRKSEGILRGRNIDFYSDSLILNNGNDCFIALQNIAYRLTANAVSGNIQDISDTITILEPKSKMSFEELKFIASYLNSSLANYLLHVNCLNNSRLTIHIDGYYISDLPIPNLKESQIASTNKELQKYNKTVELNAKRNTLFFNLFDIKNNLQNIISEYWVAPRFKRK